MIIKAVLIMLSLNNFGPQFVDMKIVEGQDVKLNNALNQCMMMGENWLYEDLDKHVAFKCVPVYKQVSM